VNKVLASTIAVVVVNGDHRAIDRKLLEVGTAMAVDLGVKIGEDATLQQRVFSEVNAANNVSRLELCEVSVRQPMKCRLR
jgi:hypothetical protein